MNKAEYIQDIASSTNKLNVKLKSTPFTTTKYPYYNRCYYNKNNYCGNTPPITSIN